MKEKDTYIRLKISRYMREGQVYKGERQLHIEGRHIKVKYMYTWENDGNIQKNERFTHKNEPCTDWQRKKRCE